MATKSAVYDGTMELLGVLSLGGTISANDTARMVRAYNQVYESLKTAGLASWSSDGDVPDDIVPHMEALMAFNAADTYYVPEKRYMRIMAKERVARREIRGLVIPDYESLDEVVDY